MLVLPWIVAFRDALTGRTWRTNHWVVGQQSSVDELLNQTYVLRRLFMYGCCLGRACAVFVVVWVCFCCLRCVSCFFLFDVMLSVTGNVGQQSSGDELLNQVLLQV